MACELLHALVVFMVGTAASATDRLAPQKQGHQQVKLLSHIYPGVLRLAVDVEKVARQLFEPLALQLVRLYSSDITTQGGRESAEATTLLDAIADAMAEPDAGLRGFAAKCLAEFMKWAIKQSGASASAGAGSAISGAGGGAVSGSIGPGGRKGRGGQSVGADGDGGGAGGPSAAGGGSPVHIKALMRTLLALLRHSSPHRRAAAATTFNCCYRVFREEEALVSTYALELLDGMLHMLRMAFVDPPALGTAGA